MTERGRTGDGTTGGRKTGGGKRIGRRLGLSLGFGLALGGPARAAAPGTADLEQTRAGIAFGTVFRLRALHPERAILDRALNEAVAALRQVEAALSLFRPDSQVARLNREGRIDRPDPALLDALDLARLLHDASGGAFDPTIQPLWRAWFEASAKGGRPSAETLAEARKATGFTALEIGSDRVRFTRPGMAITLNGLAQGIACDRVATVLRDHGVTTALVDTGEFAALGQASPGRPWSVAIPDAEPPRLLALETCLAVSGDQECSFLADRSEHHILDPTTGHSPRGLAMLAVSAPSAGLADGLSTAGFVLGAEHGGALVRALGGRVEALRRKA